MSSYGFEKSLAAIESSLAIDPVVIGSVSFNGPMDTRARYEFPTQNPQFGMDVIELHIMPLEQSTARDVLTDIGRAAVYIGESPILLRASYVIGVTYPELAASAVRLGMNLVRDVHCKNPLSSLELEESWDVYRELNHRPQASSFGVSGASEAAVYLPTNKFVERFSRFAE